MDNEVYINDICKSIHNSYEDKNGNVIFEVEASNENLDLQNQRTLQSALEKSQEYFVTNGVISDDHQHKTRNPDGSVETHKEKIIGEPLSVRFDKATKKTFVKGILYKGVDAAKPYIEMLKNKSSRVKASIGGIMPKIRKNTDGSETVLSFMWNDLALTCSPVNWTVGGASLSKSLLGSFRKDNRTGIYLGSLDFCKSLMAGSGTDAAEYSGGRALQSEDLEKKTTKIMDMTEDGDLFGEDESDELKKGKKSGESPENIEMGGAKMSVKKGGFSSVVNDLLKSFGSKPEDEKKKKMDSENEEADDTLDFDENEDEDSGYDDSEDVKKCGVKKSYDEEEDYLDATDLLKSMSAEIDECHARIEALEKSMSETQYSVIEVTKSFGDYLKIPNERTTVVEKSMDGTQKVNNVAGPKGKITNEDFAILKSALVSAAKNGSITLDQVQFYNSEFQKSMNGQKINPKVWNEICSIVKSNS